MINIRALYKDFSNNLKLRYKLSLVYMIIIIVPIVIVGEYSYMKSEVFMINEVESSLEKEVSQVTEDINYKLDLCRKESDSIFNNKQLRKTLMTDFSNNIPGLNEVYMDLINPTFYNLRLIQPSADIRIYTPNKTLLCSNRNIASIDDITGNPAYKPLIEQKTTFAWLPVTTLIKVARNNDYGYYSIGSTSDSSDTTYEKVITFSRSITNYDDTLLGIADLYIPVSMMDNVLKNLKLPDDGAGIYIDENRKVITSFGGGKIEASLISSILSNNKSYDITKGRDKIIVYKKTPLNRGLIIISYPRSYITERVSSIRDITRLTILFSIILVAIISFLLANLITQRLNKLMDKIQHIRDTGNTETRINIPGNDEIADIGKMLNTMMSRINELTEKQLTAEVTKRVMEIEILQDQINPHFLYNSLSSIKWAVNSSNKKDLNGVIDSLVKFYRLCLNKGNEIMKVKDELQIIKEYVNVQKFTYDATYDVIWDVDENVNEFYCIKLILQPFVENAILHGLNPKKLGGLLKIAAYLEGSSIFFIVDDNGMGFDPAEILNANTSETKMLYKGFGIENSRNRIKLTYGDIYDAKVTSQPSAGTRATIEIPALTLEDLNKTMKAVLSR